MLPIYRVLLGIGVVFLTLGAVVKSSSSLFLLPGLIFLVLAIRWNQAEVRENGRSDSPSWLSFLLWGNEKGRERPASITVISWYLIIHGVSEILNLWMYSTEPLARKMIELGAFVRPSAFPFVNPDLLVFSCAGSLIDLICGITLLTGRSWARILCVGWFAVRLVLTFVLFRLDAGVVSDFAWLVVAVVFLFDSEADEYFTGIKASPIDWAHVDGSEAE